MAGSVLIMALTATAVGLAAASHADDGAPTPNSGATVTVPAPGVPLWGPPHDGCWRPWFYFNGSWHCG